MARISKRRIRSVILLAAGMSFGVGALCTQAPTTPNGRKEADHLRNRRYCEIFVVTRRGLSGLAAIYNTIGFNDCPDSKWRTLNVDQLMKQTGAYRILLNGPRYFVMDRNVLRNPGAERDFNGLKTRLVAKIRIQQGSDQRAFYTENTVERQSCYVYEAGKYVYQLQAPGDGSYIMQSYSVEVDSRLDESGLKGLGSRLSLPIGWRYEVRELKSDLTVCNTGRTAEVLQDSLKNTYQRLEPYLSKQLASQPELGNIR